MNKIFKIITKKYSSNVENFYKKAMKELKDFYIINWNENTPVLFLVDSRKDYDVLINQNTENWEVGRHIGENKILLITPESYEKESIHKYSDEEYFFLIKHELSHLFYNIFSQGQRPVWLDEGFAIFTSGELKKKTKINEFKNFLDYYSHSDEKIYKESGFAVQVLIEKFGKNKVLDFLKKLPKIEDEKEFKKSFEGYFGFKPDYKAFNNLI
jgi:hypothetical protein